MRECGNILQTTKDVMLWQFNFLYYFYQVSSSKYWSTMKKLHLQLSLSCHDPHLTPNALTLSWQGYKNRLYGRGGASDAPPGNKTKIKLQRHVRSQNRGSWGCQTHLNYCQVSYMCGLDKDSCNLVSMLSRPIFWCSKSKELIMWNIHARYLASPWNTILTPYRTLLLQKFDF